MEILRYLGLSTLFLALITTPAEAGFVSLAGTAPGNIFIPVTSLKETRFLTTVRQQYDFSCGSATMATLLTYHYDHPVTEQEVFLAMYEQGDKEKIRVEGFSLLDMKKYLEQNGFRAEGYRASLDQLSKANIPAVALIKEAGYNHFVLIKGIRDGKLLIGDPAAGTRIISRADFERMWTNGILFAINKSKSNSKAKNNFNRVQEWKVRAPAPIDSAILSDTSAGTQLMRPGHNDF